MTVSAQYSEMLQRSFLGASLQAWLAAALTAAIVFLALVLSRRMLVSRAGALAVRTRTRVDDALVAILAETRTWVCLSVAVLIAVGSLPLRHGHAIVASLWMIVLLLQSAIWGAAAITFWTQHHLAHRTQESDRTSIAMIGAIGVGAKVLLWIVIAATALQSVFHVAITPLITGLGISGIAVALAVQNILGDLLAALAIVFDKPFDVGDMIGVDQITGVVEHIGLKTTRLRSISGEQIIIGNGDLLKSRLRNFRRMYERRVAFNLDVAFDTPTDIVATLPQMVQAIVTAQSPVRFDRCHIASLTEWAIRVEVVYFVLDADYVRYMDIQQSINLEVLRRFSARAIRFAVPARTIRVTTTP